LINFVLGADSTFSNYFMVRIDARNGGKNGFLPAHGKYSWNYLGHTKRGSSPDKWIDVDISFDLQKVRLLLDEKLVFEKFLDSDLISIGRVGIFNEVGAVKIESFELYQS